MTTRHLASYTIGISVIILTHFYLLSIQTTMSETDTEIHSYINLIAAFMIAYYFLYNEKYIEF